MATFPNREADLARPRERRGGEVVPVTKGVMQGVSWPHAPADWHPIAKSIYNAAKKSGQADFYQQTDIAILYSIMDDLSFFKASGKRSSMMAQVIYSSLGPLLLTEGERRRARIELHQPEPEREAASITAINGYRGALGLASDSE